MSADPTRQLSRLERLKAAATAPIDPASLVAFRVVVGILTLIGAMRFLLNGWVERFFVKPTFFFKFWGFEWVEILPPAGMTAVFVAIVVLSALVITGHLYRLAVVALFVLFTYVELLDVTNYLNHYYLVSLLLLLMCFLPLGDFGVLGQQTKEDIPSPTAPAWMVWLLRFQVSVVYFYAGMAKATGDWLVHAQPMNIWLRARTELPIIGQFLDHWNVALGMSWGGFLYDTTIAAFLLYRRTRPLAYVAVVGFHLTVGLLFNIGMFPFIMIGAALIFFEPDWPRRVLRIFGVGQKATASGAGQPASAKTPHIPARSPHRLPGQIALVAIALYMTFQVVMPMRFVFYGDNVLWHEQGMRWSWRVMVREKNGSVHYRVTLPETGKTRYVYPSRYLTDHQEREMSGQPDLILQLGQHIGREFQAKGHKRVEVRVNAQASLNGRSPRPLIDPEIDLMTLEDGLSVAGWILPAPTDKPIRLRPRRNTAQRQSR